MPPTTNIQIITNALLENGAYGQGENLAASDAAFGLSKLRRMLDAWNADRLSVFAFSYLELTLLPNIQPLLIGQGVSITGVSSDGTNATYVGVNAYTEGDIVSTNGIGTIGGLNFNVSSQIIVSATPNQFVVGNPGATVGSTGVTGMAIYSTPPTDQFPNYVTASARPVKIEAANIVLNNLNPIVKCALRIRDRDWWIANTIPNVPSSIPTDLYYEPSFPNGQLFLWPEQDVNYLLELQVWTDLADITSLTQQFFLPQGYEDAVTYQLAVSLCPSYGRPLDQTLLGLATNAKLKIQNRNSYSPKIQTRDSGIPRGNRGGTLFNWLNGTTVPPR